VTCETFIENVWLLASFIAINPQSLFFQNVIVKSYNATECLDSVHLEAVKLGGKVTTVISVSVCVISIVTNLYIL